MSISGYYGHEPSGYFGSCSAQAGTFGSENRVSLAGSQAEASDIQHDYVQNESLGRGKLSFFTPQMMNLRLYFNETHCDLYFFN